MRGRKPIKGAVALLLSLGLLLAGLTSAQQAPPEHHPVERVYFHDDEGRLCVIHTRSSDPPVCQEIAQTSEHLVSAAWVTYTNSAVGYRLDHPASWRVGEVAGGYETDLSLDESVGVAIYAQPLEPDTAQHLAALPPDELAALMVDGLRGEIPDFHLVHVGEGTLAGTPAGVIDFTATNGATLATSTGRVVVRIRGTHLLVLVFKADTAKHLDHQGTFERMAASFAYVSTASYVDEVYGFRLDYPLGWRLDERPGLERSLLKGTTRLVERDGVSVRATSYPEVRSVAIFNADAAVILHAYPLADVPGDTPSEWSSLMIEALRAELGDFELLGIEAAQVADLPASAITFSGLDPYSETLVTGTTFVFVTRSHLYTLTFEAPSALHADYRTDFEAMRASVAMLSELEREPAICCALPPDPFEGGFASEALTLTLQGDNGHYTGQLVFGDQTFPVTAQVRDGRLSGSFESEGTAFAFTASLEGATLTFVTDGTSYVLQKR